MSDHLLHEESRVVSLESPAIAKNVFATGLHGKTLSRYKEVVSWFLRMYATDNDIIAHAIKPLEFYKKKFNEWLIRSTRRSYTPEPYVAEESSKNGIQVVDLRRIR